MALFEAILLLYLLDIAVGENVDIMNPTERCIPTATQIGTCHLCTCKTDGVYHCRGIWCDLTKRNITEQSLPECSPSHTYRHDTLFCTCDQTGHWRSERCHRRLNQIRPTTNRFMLRISTNIQCTPEHFYVYECNICVCDKSGFINFAFCTKRHCPVKSKLHSCNPGNVIRTAEELCACSDINYFIDRLCIKLNDKPMQEVEAKALDKIIDFGSYWHDLRVKCKAFYTYTIDCSHCYCNGNGEIYECEFEKCVNRSFEDVSGLRSGKPIGHFRDLPELTSLETCTPGIKYRYKCNTCYCTAERRPICTSMISQRKAGHTDINSLPEIRDGEPCFPNRMYKMDCNKCRCTKDQSLMCTKMACYNWKNLKPKERKKALRDEDSNEKSYLPKVQPGTLCKPGKLYRSKCKRCFCTEDNKIVCSTKQRDACTFDKHGNPPPVQTPEDIHSVAVSDTVGILNVPSASEQCVPGRSYKVDCNFCLCMDSGNLLCQRKLCLSYEDMHRIEAKEMSGKPCNPAVMPTPRVCITCKCIDEKTLCSSTPDCAEKPKILQLAGTDEPPDQLDPNSDKFRCLPHTIYKTDCNKCYCQDDGSLRCTQKTCLNYSQVKLLEKQREYLERHGL